MGEPYFSQTVNYGLISTDILGLRARTEWLSCLENEHRFLNEQFVIEMYAFFCHC
jgi:hypothetical protein